MTIETIGETYAEVAARRREKRDLLGRLLENEKSKTPRLHRELKTHGDDVSQLQRRYDVLLRHANEGHAEARLALSTVCDQLSQAEQSYRSDQNALDGVQKRIADFTDQIERMAAEHVDTAADVQELDNVLSEIHSERLGAAEHDGKMRAEHATIIRRMGDGLAWPWTRQK